MRPFDLNKLRDFAASTGISLRVEFSEASDEYEVEVHSPAPEECLYMKRCPSVEYFILEWNKQIERYVQEKISND